MNFRIGKYSDYYELAKIHYRSGQFQKDGFMYKLGFNFLKAYYKILLTEKESFILIAEDSSHKVHGFVSGTQSAANHLIALRNKRISLGISILWRLIFHPIIWIEIINRYKFVNKADDADSFGVINGARLEYWIWDKESSSNLSVLLLKSWLNMMKEMGVTEIHGEVDKSNIKSQKVHQLMSAVFYKTERLSDGRERTFYKYLFN
tara:strand:- start:1232 stop:1846 length:615 start_codon:yes stop_codon:yes gene_type:complete